MRVPRQRTLIASVGLIALTSCDDTQSPRLEQRPFEGILRFDERCQVIGGDSTDFWPRPSCVPPDSSIFCGGPANYSLEGACPNPAGTATWIRFQIPAPDSVWVLVYDRTNAPPIDTLYAQRMPTGTHGFRWRNARGPGIFRVEMRTQSGFRSHGDVEFTP